MENSNVLKMPERLDEADRTYLNSALSQLNEANAVLRFVRDQLAARYKLGEGDQITPDGVIIRKG